MPIKRVPMQKIFRERYKKLKIDKRVLILILVGWILSFFINLKIVLFASFFIISNAILLSIDRYIQMPVDIEFSTFAAILFTLAFSLKWGIFIGIATKVGAMMYNANVRADHFFMIGGYVMAAVIANLLRGMNVVTIGIITVLIVNTYIYLVSKYITNLYPFEILMYGGSNIIWNLILFSGFSSFLLKIMKI
ncbi:hypothetical protein JW930_03390 [Candidatus Woesearchaeota archaeon]|nr:hypothetical protein [Candidatus Woesearchaeota archaeon]